MHSICGYLESQISYEYFVQGFSNIGNAGMAISANLSFLDAIASLEWDGESQY